MNNEIWIVESGYDYEGNSIEKIFQKEKDCLDFVKNKYPNAIIRKGDDCICFDNDYKFEPDWITIKKYVIELG